MWCIVALEVSDWFLFFLFFFFFDGMLGSREVGIEMDFCSTNT
jgi:hypothetical protein